MNHKDRTWDEHLAAIKAKLTSIAVEAGLDPATAFYDVVFNISNPNKLPDGWSLVVVNAHGRTTFVSYIFNQPK